MGHCCLSIVLVAFKGERSELVTVDGGTRTQTRKIRCRLGEIYVQEILPPPPPGFSIMSDAETGDLESLHCLHHLYLLKDSTLPHSSLLVSSSAS